MRFHSLCFAVAVTSLAAACAEDSSASISTDDDVELATAGVDKADRAASDAAAQSATYYAVRVDTRRCAAPGCGGYFVNRVNYSRTKCNDGQYHDACYVASIDLENGLGLDADEVDAFRADIAAGRALVRGSIKTGAQNLGVFAPTEAWRTATDRAPTGTYYKVTDAHIQCFVAPCPTYKQYKLNSTATAALHDVDLSGAGVDEIQADAVLGELDQAPVLAVGSDTAFTVSGRSGLKLAATQYYVRVSHDGTTAYAPSADELVGHSFADATAGAYARTYSFDASSVTLSDAVAPCPAGSVCVWSGYVTRTATWTLEGDRVRLSYTSAASQSTGGISYADTLAARHDGAGNTVLVEVGADGSLGGRRFR